MKFQAAFSYLKRGHDIKLPEWGGFWRWHAEGKTIHMHTRHGTILDIRKSEDMDYTLGFTFRDDWELVEDAGRTEHAKKAVERPITPGGGLVDWGGVSQPDPIVSPPHPDPWWRPPECPRCQTHHFVGLPCPPFLTIC